MNEIQGTLLIVDDEQSIRHSLRTILGTRGFQIIEQHAERRRLPWSGQRTWMRCFSTLICRASAALGRGVARFAGHFQQCLFLCSLSTAAKITRWKLLMQAPTTTSQSRSS
jgi:hypothetical protein